MQERLHDTAAKDAAEDAAETMREFSFEEAARYLPHLAKDANKYTRGRCIVVAGSAKYPGAACLAASAASRTGAGYVEVFCAPESVNVVRAWQPSLVVHSWDDLSERAKGNLSECAKGDLSECALSENNLDKPLAYVLGPGFDTSEECARIALFVLKYAKAPVVVDGGALSTLASAEGLAVVHNRAEQGLITLATPHAGEAARLARVCDAKKDDAYHSSNGYDTHDNNEDTEQASLARSIARAFRMIVVAKGPDTFVSDGTSILAVRNGGPELAKAGSGDVLAGAVGALLAQNANAPEKSALYAGALGATLHAHAGNLAAKRLSDVSVIPEDVLTSLPQAIKELYSYR